MCGICGIVNLSGEVEFDTDLLHRMNNAIVHRGPDADGFFVNDRVGLAMRRLSIIDLQGGHQPIFNETQEICVVLNGEIYNHRELREVLEKTGHIFRTSSDTEAIVHAYEQWGLDCVSKLRGMFAFALWDATEQRLIIARDRLGQKPLYYQDNGRWLIFGSEIKSILQDTNVPRHLNMDMLPAYLLLGYVPAPDTLFDGIYKLPAGHMMIVKGANYEIREYWDVRYDTGQQLTEEEYREALKDRLRESVRMRLMSDVPLGAFLSGGIDSSMVVSLMSEYMSQPVNTYSVGFTEEQLNELPFAAVTAEALGTNHHTIGVNQCEPELIEKLLWHLDEPIADPATVPTFLVSQLARETVTVVLTGEGGDELFAGYSYYRGQLSANQRRVLPPGLSMQLIPSVARAFNRLSGRNRFHHRTIWNWSMPPEYSLIAWGAINTDAELARLWDPTYKALPTENPAKSAYARYYQACESPDPLNPLIYTDTKVWLPDDLLMKVDKMSMATSLEARCPFLDHVLVDFAATIPAHLKLNGQTEKYILRQVAQELLPEVIFNRPKRTFDVPIGRWLQTDLCDYTRDLLENGLFHDAHLFNNTQISSTLWPTLEQGEPGVARQLWSLLCLGVWERQYNVTIA